MSIFKFADLDFLTQIEMSNDDADSSYPVTWVPALTRSFKRICPFGS